MIYTNKSGVMTQISNILSVSNAYINDYLMAYKWLKADGTNIIGAYRPIAGSNVNKSKDITLKAKVKVDSLRDIGRRTALSGASSVIDNIRGRYLSIFFYRIDDNNFSVGYAGCVSNDLEMEVFGQYHIGDVLDIVGTEKTLTINGVVYNKTIEEMNTRNLSMMTVLHSADVLRDQKYNGQIANLQYITSDGIVQSDLTPAKVVVDLPAELSYNNIIVPAGTAGMWDSVNNKFLTSANPNNWILTN